MKPICLLIVGIVVGWAALGVNWSREAIGQGSPPPTAGAERSIRRERDGFLRRRGLLPPREAAAPNPATDAPPYDPNGNEPKPYVPPGFDRQGPVLGLEEIVEPIPTPSSGMTSGSEIGRFQVSAYGSPSSNGCYIIDTKTGRTWRVANGQPPQLVGELPQPDSIRPTPTYQERLLAPTPGPILDEPIADPAESSIPGPTPDPAD